jgi:hypothetical protein
LNPYCTPAFESTHMALSSMTLCGRMSDGMCNRRIVQTHKNAMMIGVVLLCLVLNPANASLEGRPTTLSWKETVVRTKAKPMIKMTRLGSERIGSRVEMDVNVLNNKSDETESPTTAILTSSPTASPTPSQEPHHQTRKHGLTTEEWVAVWMLASVLGGVVVWLCYTYRRLLHNFLMDTWNAFRRYGCKGCIRSCCRRLRPSSNSRASAPLNEVIFDPDERGEYNQRLLS